MTSRRRSLVLLSGGLMTSTVTRAAQAASPKTSPLALRIPASKAAKNQQWLALKGFHLVITNQSREQQGVWEDWCSWGWDCPTITIKTGASTYAFKKAEMFWTRNFPAPYWIEPGNHYLLPVNLFSKDWIQPKGFKPDPEVEALISASFKVAPDDDSKTQGIWTGERHCEMRAYMDTREPKSLF